jgi:hypothetical protein
VKLTVGEVIKGLAHHGILGIDKVLRPILLHRADSGDDDAHDELQIITGWQILTFRKIRELRPDLYEAATAAAKPWAFPPALPADAFAIAAALLTRSGAYHHIEPDAVRLDDKSTPIERHGLRRVLVTRKLRRKCNACGDYWRMNPLPAISTSSEARDFADYYFDAWKELILNWDTPVFCFIADDDNPPQWWRAALKILMISDRASYNVGFHHSENPDAVPEGRKRRRPKKVDRGDPKFFWSEIAFAMLGLPEGQSGESAYFTISTVDPDIVCVAPKSRTAQIGCTLRSFSHNLALLPPKGLVRSKWIGMNSKPDWRRPGVDRRYHDSIVEQRRTTDPFNLMVIPYPFEIKASDFRSATEVEKVKVSWRTFDAFPMRSGSDDQVDQIKRFVSSLLASARKDAGAVHGVVLPELALSSRAYRRLEQDVFRRSDDVEFFCTGLFQRPRLLIDDDVNLPPEIEKGNFAAMAVYYWDPKLGAKAPFEVRHRKHHRWRLDPSQIANYALGGALDPSGFWWENTRTFNREVPIIAMRQGWTVTTLICEDLARIDPAQEIVRSIGPNLVIALLMDGAQIKSRWPARYATVLADDPGSSVITLTSLGLIERANACGRVDASRSIGLWQGGALSPLRTLDLPQGAHALLLSLSVSSDEEFTLDGRRDRFNAYTLNLAAVRALKADCPPPEWGA